MRTVSVKLGSDLSTVSIHIFSDWHIGDKLCDMDRIEQTIKNVAEDESAYAICIGDLVNNATKTSVSDCYAEKLSPMEQLAKITELLRPVKKKILLLTQGNHEARTYRNDGIDLTAVVAQNLGLDDRYCREGGLLFLRFGNSTKKQSRHDTTGGSYTIYATHGSGGGRKEGAKAIRLADMANIVDADIYIHGHTHLPMVMKQMYYRTCAAHSKVFPVERLFVNSSAQMNYGGYGQTFECKPMSKESPVIYLSGTEKSFNAKL